MELQNLLEKAQTFHKDRVKYGKGFQDCPVLYRNKDEKYFNDILNGDGIMKTYCKEVENDPRCPVNEKLKGVYFGCNAMNGKPMEKSLYGDTRLLCPCSMINGYSLYFADFYCHGKGKHYVTIVAAKAGSEADETCDAHLIKESRPFLFFNERGVLQVSCVGKLWIELFFTESIDISGAKRLKDFNSFDGKSMGLLARKPKLKKGCASCNIDKMKPLQAQRQQTQVPPQTDNRVLATKSRSRSSKVPQAPPTPPPPHVCAGQNAYQQQGGHPYVNSSADAVANALPEQIQRVQLSQSAGGHDNFQGTQTAPTHPTPRPIRHPSNRYPGQPRFPLSQQANVGAQTSHTSGMLGQDPASCGGGNQALAGMNYRPRHGRR